MKNFGIGNMPAVNTTGPGSAPKLSEGGKGFGEALKEAINEVNDLQIKADQSINDLSTGKVKDIHETMIALQKADISFQTIMQVRNKIVESYQEIMRTQI